MFIKQLYCFIVASIAENYIDVYRTPRRISVIIVVIWKNMYILQFFIYSGRSDPSICEENVFKFS